MRLVSSIVLLPALSSAFVPAPALNLPRIQQLKSSSLPIDDFCNSITETTDKVLEKTDETILDRAMRIVDHAPILATLYMFGKKVASSSKMGIDAAPSAIASSVASPPLLELHPAVFYIWPLISIAQLVSVAKSSLIGSKSELSQREISTLAVANVAATKAVTSGTPLRYLILTSILSSKGSDSDVTIHNAAFQLMSSFTAVASILGIAAKIPGIVPSLEGQSEIVATVGLGAYYALTKRSGNGKVKSAINALVIGGVLVARVTDAGFALNAASLLSVSLVGTVFVSFAAIQKLLSHFSSKENGEE